MKLKGRTILITGGTSGIGFELTHEFLALGNTVIVTGRDPKKLADIKQTLKGVHTIQSDVSDVKAIAALFQTVTRDFPALDVLINNAGIMRKLDLQAKAIDLTDLTREIETNLMGPIRMTAQFVPHLKKQKSATIINVSSGLAFVPLSISPVYCATKAGLHSFTQSLRLQLKNTKIEVLELAPPGTDTPLFSDEFTSADVGGIKGMNVQKLARAAVKGFGSSSPEITPGLAHMLKLMSRVAPTFITKQLGKSVDIMHANHSKNS